MIATILAGGKGQRLGDKTRDTPKPMVRVNNRPVLEYQLAVMKRQGVQEVYMLTEHLAEKIEEGLKGNVETPLLHFIRETHPLGSGGALAALSSVLKSSFLVFFGDLIFQMDLRKLFNFHHQNHADITLVVHPTDHPHDSDLIEAGDDGSIQALHLKPHSHAVEGLGNSGVFVVSPRIFELLDGETKRDLMKDVLPMMIKNGFQCFAYETNEYIKDMGTPERLSLVEKDLKSGRVVVELP